MKTDEAFDVNPTVKQGSLRISLILVLVSRGMEAIRAVEQGGASERETGGAIFTGAWYRG
jgi:hypothetical protein